MVTLPTDFKLDPDLRELTLSWTDGEVTRHGYTELRRLCPCADCDVERQKAKKLKGLRVLSGSRPPQAEPTLERVEPVGRYALRLIWGDGHSSGIYTFEFLRRPR